jgi:geranylgeranylglycerol-phosphate geranylgeranyltransferase
MMGFAVIVGAELANPDALRSSLFNLLLGFVTGFALTAASMAINDYYDREIDAVNEPKRPIPNGVVKPNEALVLAFILTIVGFTATYLITYLTKSDLCLLIAVISWIVSVAYTTVGKRSGLPGNFLVSVCVAIPFVYGSAIVSNSITLNSWFFVAMVIPSITGREVTKGIVDKRGDEMRGVKTLAVRYGERKAAIAAAFFYLLAVAISPIPWILGIVSFWYVLLVALTDFGLTVSSFMLVKDYSRENARRIKNVVLLWFIVGLLAFIVGSFSF